MSKLDDIIEKLERLPRKVYVRVKREEMVPTIEDEALEEFQAQGVAVD